MHWYKRDPDAALAGMAELTNEECGVYNRLLDLLYSRDGNVPDNDKDIARMINNDPRSWLRIKKQLMARGKIWVLNGKITAKRVEDTLKDSQKFSEHQAEVATKGWEKRRKNKAPPKPDGSASTSTSTTTTTKKERKQSAHPIPDDWIPKTESVQKAQALGFNPREIHREAEKFKYHARENDRRAVRWDDAFNRWMVNAAGYANKRPPDEKREFYPALPGSPQFIAWKTYWTDTRNPMVRELKQRELEGRAFKFEAVWPPTYAQQEAAE